MADNTGIAWTDATWNVAVGCRRVAEGCRHCYAEGLSGRRLREHPKYKGLATWSDGHGHWTGEARIWPDVLDQPLRWTRPRRIFVTAMGDLFYERIPEADVDLVYAFMALAPQHQFQNLTKRGERRREYLTAAAGERVRAVVTKLAALRIEEPCCESSHRPRDTACLWPFEAGKNGRCVYCDHATECHPGPGATCSIGASKSGNPRLVMKAARACLTHWRWPLPNVIEMVSCSEQESADDQIPHLLATDCALRGVSYEPALGPVDFSAFFGYNPQHEINGEERGVRPRGGEGGAPGTSPRRDGLASARLSEDPARGEVPAVVEVHDGKSDARREAGRGRPAQADLFALRRADPAGADDQPQGRRPNEQSAGELGAGDLCRAGEACGRGARPDTERAEWRAERDGQADREGCKGDSAATGGRGATEVHRGGVRRVGSGGIEDRARAALGGISWLIVGGESGAHARPNDLAWARAARDQCKAAGVAYFCKQLGAKPFDSARGDTPTTFSGPTVLDRAGADPDEWPEDLRVREFPCSPEASA